MTRPGDLRVLQAKFEQPQSLFADPRNPRPEDSNTASSSSNQSTLHNFFTARPTEAATAGEALGSRVPPNRRGAGARSQRRAGRDSVRGSPSSTTRQGSEDLQSTFSYEHDLALALHYDLLGADGPDPLEEEWDDDDFPAAYGSWLAQEDAIFGWEGEADLPQPRFITRPSASDASSNPFDSFHRIMAGASKRSRDKYESADDKDITRTLLKKGAVAVILYDSTSPNPEANDIWPECRSSSKLPARYFLLDRAKEATQTAPETKAKRRSRKKAEAKTANQRQDTHDAISGSVGRPEWKLPVELLELIAGHLNRDDIKALRLVSRELNNHVSQVIFQTVVVPFNTEIYGMLRQEAKPDLKGKKRARIERPGYSWNNANGDEVYNGHGLDVFRGFGGHIRKFGMSFEVTEESLSMPPIKSLTEKKTSFWGDYDWPFEEYRRFDAVAGLETAADETPRMKTAFSELKKVRELALSIDSGLGWLSGPDRSIRARVLQRPPQVFGTNKAIPDRKAQAQQELWDHIEACHQSAGSDVRLAALYKMDGQRPLSELKEASMVADVQPSMPYLDPQLIHEAAPHDTADLPVPTSFDDPYVLDRFVSTPTSLGTGVVFTSTISALDGGQLMNPIIPAKLTKAQKEWLLETEWAQRAFISSYMLSVIDNPTTFREVHTLNVSGLSGRYLPNLNRSDFWNALPSLKDVTIMVIPGFRNVHKDEAGFVETSRTDPTQNVNTFFDLLRDHVACRPNIRNLTVGWITGGEHAEGLHARNKLLFPVPFMDLGFRLPHMVPLTPSPLVETDATCLRTSLLQFPHVERLKLMNCWITPPALLQFVKVHDAHRLQTLVLDSVSLTAVLRPIANVHVAQQAAVFQNAAAQAQLGVGALFNAVGAHPGNQQLLQVYVQTLQFQLQQLQANAGNAQQQNQIAALQTQLQQQVPQPQNANGQHNANGQQPPLQFIWPAQGQAPMPAQPQQGQPAQPQVNFANFVHIAMQVHQLQHQAAAGQQAVPIPAANNQANADPQSALKAQPRNGSWMNIIDQISPGTNLSDFESDHSKADSERVTSLQTIEFNSCGYAKLPYASFDQPGIEAGHGLAAALRNPIFSRRAITLGPAMLSAKYSHLGEIVQEVDQSELAALDAGWNLHTGWDDAEEARAVEFDGLLPGGTGRFTGVIRQSDRVVNEASAS
jgi:hypothetical protein